MRLDGTAERRHDLADSLEFPRRYPDGYPNGFPDQCSV